MKTYRGSLKAMFTALAVLALGFASPASGWMIVPMNFKLNLAPGDTATYSFIVRNSGDDLINLDVYIRDILHNENGSLTEIEPGGVKGGIAAWIDITPHNLSLPADKKQRVRFTVKVPGNIAPGDYWANIYVERARNPQLVARRKVKGRSISVYAITRGAIQLIATIEGEMNRSGEITNVEVTPGTEETPITVHTTFRNTGNLILRCKGRVELRDECGETVEILNLGGFKVYPTGERTIKTQIKNMLNPGGYTVLSIVDFDGDYLVAGEAEFEVEKQLITGKTESEVE